MTEILTFNYLLLIRLVAAVICGGIIGWERGGTKQDSGLISLFASERHL